MGAEEVLIPIFALASICTTVFGLYYLRNKENMALIEKGMNPRTNSPEEPRRFSAIKYGLMFTGGGLGLLCAFFIEWALARTYQIEVPYYESDTVQGLRTITKTQDFPQLYFALIILGAGIGLVGAYNIIRKELNDK